MCHGCQGFTGKLLLTSRAYEDTQHTYFTLSMAHKAYMLAQPRHSVGTLSARPGTGFVNSKG